MTKDAIFRRKWRAANPERELEIGRKAYAKRKKNKPWYSSYANAKKRCRLVEIDAYEGIEFNLTEDEVKELWRRDRASSMKKPSIDRIDPEGNYYFDNCRFIEHTENVSRRRTETLRGENCHMAKLKIENVLEIRKSKESNIKLSKIYGVSDRQIARIKNRQSWAWL